jgi:L-lactate dehydrogenase (cytochrome)
MLPRVADAVGNSVEVLFDGGIRTGADILRALAMGARGCLIGRAYIYGLGAGGQEGVAKAIDILKKEFDIAMALTGTNRIDEISREVIVGMETAKPATAEAKKTTAPRTRRKKLTAE